MPGNRGKAPMKDAALLDAEKHGQEQLYNLFRRRQGVQADLCRSSGILPTVVSRMSHGRAPISLEVALHVEVFTGGELLAEVLCPSRADLIKSFKAPRAPAVDVQAA